jgi:hypothetical protein
MRSLDHPLSLLQSKWTAIRLIIIAIFYPQYNSTSFFDTCSDATIAANARIFYTNHSQTERNL